jgi:hypothetical protein
VREDPVLDRDRRDQAFILRAAEEAGLAQEANAASARRCASALIAGTFSGTYQPSALPSAASWPCTALAMSVQKKPSGAPISRSSSIFSSQRNSSMSSCAIPSAARRARAPRSGQPTIRR